MNLRNRWYGRRSWKMRREGWARAIAWKLPKRIAYWTFLRVQVHDYHENPANRSFSDAADSWGNGP